MEHAYLLVIKIHFQKREQVFICYWFDLAADRVKRLVSQKGYISETTSTFQLGLAGPYDWVGEDILILNDIPFPFSVIAKTEVVALKISKNDLFNKFPSEFKNLLEEQWKDRNKWLQNRVKAITNTSQIIYSQDPKQTVYDIVMNQLLTQHPQATWNAVKSFTRHHISVTGMENKGRVIKSVSTNHRKSEEPITLSAKKAYNQNTSREESYGSPKHHVNKAVYSSEPSYSQFEYQNLTGNNAYQSTIGRPKAVNYNQFSNMKKSIDISFNNLKLSKNGRVDSRGINQGLISLNRKIFTIYTCS